MAVGLIWLVANGASGSNDAAALSAVTQSLAAVGHAPARVIDISSDTLPDRAALELAGVTTLAIYTGDGTLNAAFPGLVGWGGNVLVLPGGTANLLAKALHGEDPVEEIVTRFAAGRLRSIHRDCVRSKHGIAHSEILAGPGATWSDVREGLREGAIAETAGKAVEAVRQSASGPMVVVAEPRLGRETGYAGVRLTPASGGLRVDGYGAEGFGDIIKQGIALLKRDFRTGPHDELGTHREVVCCSLDGSPIELMFDGERVTGGAQERFSLAPLEVKLLGSVNG